jgi:hypothetical protein
LSPMSRAGNSSRKLPAQHPQHAVQYRPRVMPRTAPVVGPPRRNRTTSTVGSLRRADRFRSNPRPTKSAHVQPLHEGHGDQDKYPCPHLRPNQPQFGRFGPNEPGRPRRCNCWRKKGIPRSRWRRGWESNPRIKVLQTSPLPLGYRASTVLP